MAETTYCLKWNARLRKPIDVVSEDKARARDAAARAGKNVDYYTIVFGDPQLPDAFLEVVWENDFLAVWFVDDDGRRLIEFGFRKVSAQQMFLTEIGRWQYPAGARADYRDAELIETLYYEQEGIVSHHLDDSQTGRTTITDYKEVDVSDHWIDVPAFDDLTFEWIPEWIRDSPRPKGSRSPTS
ncbi:MAG: hypothetical protein GEU96_03125 [Propionibacteriales bacterium]|nr:hypothetical protein [Propionibacteriales bacterium]